MPMPRSSRAKSAINFIDKDIAQLKREISERNADLNVLIAARAELSKTVRSSVGATKRSTGKRAEVPRVKAVQMVLDSTQQPLTAAEITEALAKNGRTEDRKSVAAAIGYLKQHGKVQSTERGKWIGQHEQQVAA